MAVALVSRMIVSRQRSSLHFSVIKVIVSDLPRVCVPPADKMWQRLEDGL